MTSTTFSDKLKQGRSFFLWSLYTGRTTMIIYLSLLTFFSIVVSVFAFGISGQMPKQWSQVWEGAAMFEIIIVQMLAFVFTFVFSVKEFSYLHDKRKTDMFGALPASRRTIFFSKLLAIIVQSAVPMLIIMVFLAIMNGDIRNYLSLSTVLESADTPEKISVWYMMLKKFTGIVVNAVFMGFLSICCGKTVDKVLTYIIINFAYPIVAFLIQAMPLSFVIGYVKTDLNDFFTCALSPYMAMSSINPIYWGCFALVFIVLCYVLLPRRKAECAQSHFAFKAPLIITKLLVSAAAGMVMAYLFGMILSAFHADKIGFIAGMLIGSFTAYFVIQIIFAKGFKGFGKGMIPYAILIVCFGVMMLVLNTGLFGYESYVPKAEDVESVSLVTDDMVKIGNKNNVDFIITDKKQIEECIAGQKDAIKCLKKKSPTIAELSFGGNNVLDFSYYDYAPLIFTYKLKDGTTVNRNYGLIKSGDIMFTSTDTYLVHTNSLFLIDPKNAEEVVIDYYSEDESDENFEADYNDDEDVDEYNIKIDGVKYNFNDELFDKEENITKIIEALKKDMLTYGTIKGDAICEIFISYGDITDDDLSVIDTETVTLRSTYKNTLDFIKKSAKAVGDNKTKKSV